MKRIHSCIAASCLREHHLIPTQGLTLLVEPLAMVAIAGLRTVVLHCCRPGTSLR